MSAIMEDDSHAYEELYNRYWASLYNAAYKRLNDMDACKDLVQDVFADLWKRRKQVRIEDAAAYLHTSVRFQLFKLVARGGRTTHLSGLFESIASSSYSASSLLQEKELQELVEAWARTLPRKRRNIFLLHYRNEISTAEIANELGISRKTVQNQLNTSLHSLRKQLSRLLFFFSLLSLFLNWFNLF